MNRRVVIIVLGAASIAWLGLVAPGAFSQNDWQSPDPYFGVFQHRDAGTPQAERRYRAEIAPQQPHRLHERRPPSSAGAPRHRWIRPRVRQRGMNEQPVRDF